MCPGVKSAVWQSDAIPPVRLDGKKEAIETTETDILCLENNVFYREISNSISAKYRSLVRLFRNNLLSLDFVTDYNACGVSTVQRTKEVTLNKTVVQMAKQVCCWSGVAGVQSPNDVHRGPKVTSLVAFSSRGRCAQHLRRIRGCDARIRHDLAHMSRKCYAQNSRTSRGLISIPHTKE
jgi:hypothetical protein